MMDQFPPFRCGGISRALRGTGLALAALAWLAAPAAVAEDAGAIRRALDAVGAKDWAGADTAAQASGPMAVDLVLWHRLRAGQGSWPEYRDFAARRADWPGMELLYRWGEERITPGLPAAEITGWFGTRRPATLQGATALAGALQGKPRAEALADFWTHAVLEPADEAAFLTAFGAEVAPFDKTRLQTLLDAGEWTAADRQLARVPAGPDADLARARISVQARRTGVDALILALPPAQQADAGLALDRFLWRVAAKQGDEARALMLERSTSAEALRDPVRWAGLRRDYARAALRAEDWALAERLAANHFLPAAAETVEAAADLDWLAGYAALRAGSPDRAAAHFARLPVTGSGPVTMSRGFYWQGRAAEAMGRAGDARRAYADAARYQSAFYGQLAAERIGAPMDPALAVGGPAAPTLPDWRGGGVLAENDVFQAGEWLAAAGRPDLAQRFFLHLADSASPQDTGRMARLMFELRRPWDGLRLAKAAAAKGVVYPAAYFPLTGLERAELGLPPELVLSIARRESEFNHTVSSHAGAKGLMQVMPDTARQMAGVIGEPYDLPRLTRDAAYNARLGSAYLDGLRARFGGSIALVAAGYNAGPGRSARWLQDFGDLRRTGAGSADPVDWVEMIPFDETRTYVMRVAESLPVYRARIAGHPVPIVPTWDLRGGGLDPRPRISPLVLAVSQAPRPTPGYIREAAQRLAMAEAVAAAPAAPLSGGAGTSPSPDTPTAGDEVAARLPAHAPTTVAPGLLPADMPDAPILHTLSGRLQSLVRD